MTNQLKKFVLADYKSKHFTIQDELHELDVSAFPMKEISKEEALKPSFIEVHKDACLYYGIPAVITKDKDLLKAYD